MLKISSLSVQQQRFSQTLIFFPVPSLLKVHLQVRGYSVFIDVEKLEAGKFEDKLIQSVQRARNFILVLSANALDKCMGDTGMKDWVHKVRRFPFSALRDCTCILIQQLNSISWNTSDQISEGCM